MNHLIEISSESHLDRFAAALVQAAPPRAVVCLTGTLGAGKTRLVRGIAAAVGVEPTDVVSPTFVLCQTYQGDRTLHHFDAYRLADDDEFLELGADEHMESEAMTLIEWGERVIRCLPDDRLDLVIHITGESTRQIELHGAGPECADWVSRLRQNESDFAADSNVD